MCRFLVYLGQPVLLNTVITLPGNSLIHQSKQAKEMINTAEVNGDGFGVGWYTPEISEEPAVFKSIRPAWNDLNLDYLLPKIRSHCFLAHIRAAMHGGVEFANSHPFHYGRYLFIHNGMIGGFQTIKRHMRHRLSDAMYGWVQGQTDTEHMAALYLERLADRDKRASMDEMAGTLRQVIAEIRELQVEFGVPDDALTVLNFVICDGEKVLISRYASDLARASTLYYAFGERYTCEGELCQLPQGERVGAVIVASEKLDSDDMHWQEVPKNHLVLLEKGRAPRLAEI